MLRARHVGKRGCVSPCNSFVHWFIASTLVAVCAAILATNAFAQSKTVDFDIPAQPASSALRAYARQADVRLLVSMSGLNTIQANAVIGSFSPQSALQALLAGTGIRAEYRSDSTVAIAQESDVAVQPVGSVDSGETLSDLVAQATVQTDERVVNTETSQAEQNNESERAEEAAREIEEIMVTGSRIRGARNASPVITFTREAIDRAGFATVEELVDKLPQNFGGGASLDASTDFANTANVIGGRVDDIAGGASVNLRGLGASSTLVLLNGRRMSPSGFSARFTNISSIPVTAIERVEVLTDGASAIYGSDAIGGVINFILRDNYEGAETRLRYGVDTGGDKPEILFGQSFGKSWGSGNVLFSYEYYDTDNLANADRGITASNDLSRFGGTDWRTVGGTLANIEAGGQNFAIPAGQNGRGLVSSDFTSVEDGGPSLNRYNARAVGDVIPAQERHSAFLHLRQNVGKTELFTELQFSTQDRQTRTNFFPFDLTIPDTNAFFVDPTGTGLTSVTVANYSVDDDIGASLGFGEIDSIGSALGMRFDINEDWNGELVGSWFREEATSGNRLTFNDDFAASLISSDPDLAFNPFGDGSNTSPALLESLLDRSRRVGSESENELWGFSFNVDGNAFDISGGAVQVAAGIEFREESLLAMSNINSDNSRDVTAVYAEAFFPLVGTANSRPGLRRFEFSLAARYEDYSDFGSSTNPKVGLAWSPTEAFTLRGTYGTSFRAPALFDLDVTIPGSNNIVYLGLPLVNAGFIPVPFIARSGGNEDLKVEEAATWTAGFQWRPDRIRGLSFDVTYFNIDFEDRIDFPGAGLISGSNDPRFATLFNTSPTQELIASLANDPRWVETFFGITTTPEDILSGAAPVEAILDLRKTNLAQSVVTGTELQLSYDFETAIGSFAVSLNGNYMFDFERKLLSTDPLVDEVDTLGRPIDFRARGSVSWSREGWLVSAFVDHMDGYTDNISDPARSIDSWTTSDLTVSYATRDGRGFFRGSRFSLTIQNVFDEDPPFVDTFGGLAYDSVNGNPLGRFTGFQVTKDW